MQAVIPVTQERPVHEQQPILTSARAGHPRATPLDRLVPELEPCGRRCGCTTCGTAPPPRRWLRTWTGVLVAEGQGVRVAEEVDGLVVFAGFLGADGGLHPVPRGFEVLG